MSRSILITSPSLAATKNIGGISSLTRLLIAKNNNVNYTHFVVGKSDIQKRNAKWLFSQINLVLKYIRAIRHSDIEITHINCPMSYLSIFVNFILILISKFYKKKILVHLRGGALSQNTNIYFFQKTIIRLSLIAANKVLVLGERECLFVSDFYDIPFDKIEILPNAVEVPDDLNQKYILNNFDPINILFLGRIDKDKGLNEILLALDALNSTVNYHFYLAGTGPDEEKFLSDCFEMIGDKFTYLGVLNGDEKIPVLCNSDIFILPSYFEGLPNSLLESMAYGAVPIVTPVGSIPEVVLDNINGFLIPKSDYMTIADRITELHNDRKKLKKMSELAFDTIANSYSIDNYINMLNKVYDKM
jgi:glycosyltransferase involved in cell wall biosynthesis